jgi:hypothetical protein
VLGWAIEEAEQAVEVAFKAGDRSRCFFAPAPGPGPVSLHGSALRLGLVDRLRLFEALLLASFEVVGDVAQLMHPAVLAGNVREDRLQGSVQPLAAVGDDESQVLAEEAALRQLPEEGFPVGGALRGC